MKSIHVVPHTHWDREWYFTLQDTLVLSDVLFTQVIEEPEKNPKATYCLDGQASILEDYIRIRPENKERIEKLVAEGRLSIGPWYTQTDCLYVNGESIIRNLAYGTYLSRKLGAPMDICYLPDSFGFNAQMPTIAANCGIPDLIFRRGGDYQMNLPDAYFKWKGLGSKTVNAIHLLEGYGIGNKFNSQDEFYEKRLAPYVARLSEVTESDILLICAGGDQSNIISNLGEKIETINQKFNQNYLESTYPQFAESIKGYISKEYQGEFREPRIDRVHRTIGGIRYDIKYNNYILEQKIIKRVEPLMAIAEAHGIRISSGVLYEAWRNMMEGHAHDAMGGCVTDNVAEQIIHRFQLADEIVDGIENYVKNKIAEQLELDENKLLVFNTDIKSFSGVVDVEFMSSRNNVTIANHKFEKTDDFFFTGKQNLLLELPEGDTYINEKPYYQISGKVECQLPAMGYKVLTIEEAAEKETKNINGLSIENAHYQIDFEKGIKLIDKRSGEIIDNLITFEDCGNDGDTYDYSPLAVDVPIKFEPSLKSIERNKLSQTAKLTAKVQLPIDLEHRVDRTKTTEYRLDITITLIDSELVDVRIDVDNNVLSHRLRAVINSNINDPKSISAVPFGYIEREILNGEIKDWDGYAELPIDINPTDDFCALSNKTTIYVPTAGIKEYQVEGNQIKLTLLSTTSELGKPNLAYRPGRASGDTTKKGHVMIQTPSAELIGNCQFHFAIAYASNPFCENKANKLQAEFRKPSIHYQLQGLNKFINRLDNKIMADYSPQKRTAQMYSLLELNTELELCSLSPSLYDPGYYLLRLKNATREEVEIPSIGYEYVCVDGRESCIETITRVGAYDFITIKFKIEE